MAASGLMFEAIVEAASRGLVDLHEPMLDQPLAHGLFVTTATRLIGVKRTHHIGTADLQRLRNGQPIVPDATLARHRLLAMANDIGNGCWVVLAQPIGGWRHRCTTGAIA